MTGSGSRAVLGRQVGVFAIIGVASTLLNVVLFYLLNLGLPNQIANGLSLVICTILNTGANRRFTFGVRGRQGAGKAQLQGLVLWLATWATTALALFALTAIDPQASAVQQSAVQFGGNLVATAVRFVLLRKWFTPNAPGSEVAADALPTEAERV